MASSRSPDHSNSSRQQDIEVPLIRGNQYRGISAGGQARQHNGNVYNTNTNNYTIRQRRSDETLRESDLNQRFLRAAAEGQTRRMEVLHQRGADVDFTDECDMTPLHHACFSGFEDTVEMLIQMGSDVNAHSKAYGPPLCLAASKGRVNVIDILLKARANVLANGGLLGSALHAACASGDVRVAEKLIELGCPTDTIRTYCCASVDEVLDGRFTKVTLKQYYNDGQPLHIAARYGRLEVVQLLISNGVAVNALYRSWTVVDEVHSTYNTADHKHRLDNRTALMVAAARDRSRVISTLLGVGADPNLQDSVGTTALTLAAENGNKVCLSTLIEAGANINIQDQQGYTAMLNAARSGNVDALEALTSAGAPLDCRNYEGRTALSIVASEGHTECIKLLVEKGADVGDCDQDECEWTPLHWAARNGNSESLLRLLEAGAALEARSLDRGRTALSLAVIYGHTSCAEILLQRGADVDIRDREGHQNTPLHWAAQDGYLNTAQALLEHGADVNAADSYQTTPLHRAAVEGHLATVKVLLDSGADINAVNDRGDTPLLLVAKRGHPSTAHALLEKGAAVDTINNYGDSPLIIAALQGYAAVTQELVASGAATGLTSKSGKTALTYAKENGHTEVAQILEPATLSRAHRARHGARRTADRRLKKQYDLRGVKSVHT